MELIDASRDDNVQFPNCQVFKFASKVLKLEKQIIETLTPKAKLNNQKQWTLSKLLWTLFHGSNRHAPTALLVFVMASTVASVVACMELFVLGNMGARMNPKRVEDCIATDSSCMRPWRLK